MSTVIKEGKAEILSRGNEAFYNNVQVVNRDLSVCALNAFNTVRATGKKATTAPMRVLEALGATGLRSMRYAKEVANIESIVCNDLDPNATEIITANAKHNGLDASIVKPSCADAIDLMHASKHAFDVIDIDPYGSASPFLDSAMHSIANGGMLCITSTDMRNLAGNEASAAFLLYGSMPLKAHFKSEMAVRILLSMALQTAARYKKTIQPLLSLQIDFYARIWIRVYESPKAAHDAALRQGLVWNCSGCGSFHTLTQGKKVELKQGYKVIANNGPGVDRYCSECHRTYQMGGPVFIDRIHDRDFITEALRHANTDREQFKYADKVIGLLSVARDELSDVPFGYDLPQMCRTLRTSVPSKVEFASAVARLGYQLSEAHYGATVFKTDAPNNAVWDILRCWARRKPSTKLAEGSPGYRIVQKEPELEADFTVLPEVRDKKESLAGTKRFMPNPEENWGPKSRARKGMEGVDLKAKSTSLQGKNSGKRERGPCKMYQIGDCRKGDRCTYKHDK